MRLSSDEVERELGLIRLPRWGQVVQAEGVVPFLVVDPAGQPVEPIRRFLRDFVARGNRPGSVRSYAYDLMRWWRWLQVVDVGWDKATSTEVRDFVLWLKQAAKPRNFPRTMSAATAGTVNPVTRKRYLDDRYQARTVRHCNAVLRGFYEFWIELGAGPLVNPVPLDRGGVRSNAHHNPLEPLRPEGRLRYNPKVPKRRPREIPDARWKELFGALRSNRDRAILALAISNAARACELLGVRGVDLDWGEQLVRVVRKGSGAEQWLPASPDAFVWIRLYFAEIGPLEPNESIWWTLRRRDHGDGLRRQPMNYEALRAVFRRVNAVLGTNYSMHDLRHTCSLRMARDENLSLRDLQTILGHAHLSTISRGGGQGDPPRRRAPGRTRTSCPGATPCGCRRLRRRRSVGAVWRAPTVTLTTASAQTRRATHHLLAYEHLLEQRFVGPVDHLPTEGILTLFPRLPTWPAALTDRNSRIRGGHHDPDLAAQPSR